MFQIITGGSASGKSAYAEECSAAAHAAGGGQKPFLYLATMIPRGREAERRIARHRKLREGKSFETIECPLHLYALQIPANATVLLEDLPNLAANELFEPEGAKEKAEEEILKGVDRLCRAACNLFLVTGEVFSDGIIYEEETELFRRVLADLNRILFAEADLVTEVTCGIAVNIKENPEMEK